MSELGITWERDDLGGGRFRHTQSLRPIAYNDAGTLRRIASTWLDSGITERPHIVTASRMMVSVADDGMRRIHPTRELDRYMEVGTPYVKVGGVWKKVGFTGATRTGNSITWHRTQADLRITHGGHFIKLDLELLGGYVPEDNLIAFPVGLTGLTRSGAQIRADGETVALLRAPVVHDAGSIEGDVRPIVYQFTTLNSQPYLVMTLPSLAGMTRPVIDPTLTLQPDAAAGVDTYLKSGTAADTNFGTATSIQVKNIDPPSDFFRSGLIKFDLSDIPAAATIDTATLTGYWDWTYSGACNITVYKCLRAWVEAEVTWNVYSTGNAWGTAGCLNSTTDYVNTALASYALSGDPGAGTALAFTSAAAMVTYITSVIGGTANFVLLQSYNENKNFAISSSDHATAGYRPKLVVEYTTAGGAYWPLIHEMHGGIGRTMNGGLL